MRGNQPLWETALEAFGGGLVIACLLAIVASLAGQ